MVPAVGVDFGTTNSALAVAAPEGEARLTRFGRDDVSAFRSILYFERDSGRTGSLRAWAGPEAIQSYLEAEEPGRLIQSLKSFLASRHFSQTSVLGRAFRLEGLIEIILRALREAAEAQFGPLGGRVVAGRPVRFVGARDASDEELALARLRAAFHNAGFDDVHFEYEPVAAAYHYERGLDHDELILIADFGGGTSDFSLLRVGPTARGSGSRHEAILATAGVPVAGDSFDARIVRHVVAPLLGRGAEYRSLFGRVLSVPSWIFSHVERWHHLSFLKSRSTMQMLLDLRREALEPEKLDALIHLVREDLGFHLYRAVEGSKVDLSVQERTRLRFAAAPLRIDEEVRRCDLDTWIEDELERISECVDALLEGSGVGEADVDRVFMTGGSSFVRAVRAQFVDRFGAERIRSGQELTSVASGLALRARELAAAG